MRALIIILLSITCSNNYAKDSKDKNEILLFSITSNKKYTTQITELYKNKADLYCKTELIPYFVIEDKKQEKIILSNVNNLLNEKERPCERDEKISIHIGNKSRTVCANDKMVAETLRLLGKSCGRH